MKKIMGLFLIFLFLMPAAYTSALSCVGPIPIEEAYEKYSAVVIATVEDMKQGNHNNKFTLNVSKSFKGIDEREVVMYEDATWGTSQVGEEYLFFLNRNDDDWENPLCSPTVSTANASKQMEFLQDKENLIKSGNVPSETAAGTGTSQTPNQSSAYDWTTLTITAVCIAIVILIGIVLYRKLLKNNK